MDVVDADILPSRASNDVSLLFLVVSVLSLLPLACELAADDAAAADEGAGEFGVSEEAAADVYTDDRP